jgi:hypothetical protein
VVEFPAHTGRDSSRIRLPKALGKRQHELFVLQRVVTVTDEYLVHGFLE